MRSSFIYLSLLIVLAGTVSCKRELSIEGSGVINKAPVANAGQDMLLVLPLDSALLDGSFSSDPDGFIAGWVWTKISGPATYQLAVPNTAKTMLKKLSAGVYEFELKITDNNGATAKDTIRVTVGSNLVQINRPPVANAGTDQTIILPVNAANVNGLGSTDPDGNITQWLWTKISGPATFQIVSTNAVQTLIQNLDEGVYEFELKVTDAGGLFSKDTLTITVLPENQQASNVDFYFADPTGSLDAANIVNLTFFPQLILVTVKIANYPDGKIRGVWRKSYTPSVCPLDGDPNSSAETHTSFLLPPGTYNWTAETAITNFSAFPTVPDDFKQFMTSVHTTQGTVVIPPGYNCMVKKIVF